MSKQQSSIRIHQVNNFKNRNEMQQFVDAQVLKLQGSDKELKQAKGPSQGSQNVFQTQIRQTITQDNKKHYKKNVEQEIRNNNFQKLIESFNSMKLLKYLIDFKDDIISQSPKNQNKYPIINQTQLQKIDQQFLSSNKKQFQIQKKIINQIQQNPYQIQKQLIKKLDIESKNEELKQKYMKLIEYQRIIVQNYEKLNEKIQKENLALNKNEQNAQIQKKINALTIKFKNIQFKTVLIDQNFDKFVDDWKKKMQQLYEQNGQTGEELNIIYSTQIQDTSNKKVVSRRHNFDLYKSQLVKQQNNPKLEEQSSAQKNERLELEQEYLQKQKLIQDEKTNNSQQQDQILRLINKFQQEMMKNDEIQQNILKQQNDLNNLKISLEQLESQKQKTQEQIQQNLQELQQLIQNDNDQIKQIGNQLNNNKQELDSIPNLQLQIQNINQNYSSTEYQSKDNQDQSISDLLEMYQNNCFPLDKKTCDEILDEKQNIVMILDLDKITYVNKIRVSLPYQTKWITQESLQFQDLFHTNQQEVFIDQSIQDLHFITSDQINGYAELLQFKDQIFYFRQSKRIRKSYSRLLILPSCFLEEFRQQYQENKNLCIALILNYFEDYQPIQYQFWLIYQKIAFIIKEDQCYFVVTVNLNNRLLIIYNSIHKPSQQYDGIQDCLNYLFSQLLKEKIVFQVHISPTFPIQNQQQNYNLTAYYACIALEYYSKNLANKNFLKIQEVQDQIEKIKLKKITQSNQRDGWNENQF